MALTVWAATSVGVSFLPAGVGGPARAAYAIVFLTVGPACALAWRLSRAMPAAVVGVVALAGSLTTLLLSSQVLLSAGLWSPGRVAVLVALAVVAIAWVPRESVAEVGR